MSDWSLCNKGCLSLHRNFPDREELLWGTFSGSTLSDWLPFWYGKAVKEKCQLVEKAWGQIDQSFRHFVSAIRSATTLSISLAEHSDQVFMLQIRMLVLLLHQLCPGEKKKPLNCFDNVCIIYYQLLGTALSFISCWILPVWDNTCHQVVSMATLRIVWENEFVTFEVYFIRCSDTLHAEGQCTFTHDNNLAIHNFKNMS